MKHLILILSLLSAWGPFVNAQEPVVPMPLGFQEWKDQQVLDAQNQALRASTRLSQVRTGKPAVAGAKKTARLPNDKMRESVEDDQTVAERELKRAQEGVVSAAALTFDAYIDVYLPTLKGNPALLQKLADKLSKDELAQIFKAVMNLKSNADARHNQAILNHLALSSRK